MKTTWLAIVLHLFKNQQSVKAYVDAQITAEDLDFQGDSGTGAVDLDST